MENIKSKISKRLAALGLSLAAAISGGYLIIPQEGAVKNKGGLHTVYLDPVGIPTACYGQTGKDLYGRQIRMGMTYTEKECEIMLVSEIQEFERQVDRAVKVEYSSPWQKAALISFTYNVGIGAFRSSTLLRKLNTNNHVGACDELARWVYANKRKLPGLVNRRGEERQWCLGNVPHDVEVTFLEMVMENKKATK